MRKKDKSLPLQGRQRLYETGGGYSAVKQVVFLSRQMRVRENKTKRGIYSRFTLRMQKKLVVLFLAVLSAFIGLSLQLVRINKDNGARYEKQVLSQQAYDSTTIPFRRGDILDSNGTKLAASEKVYNVILDAKVMLNGMGNT